MRWICIAVSFTLATPTVASDLSLSWPVDCELGTDCYIQQYVDHDPSQAAHDFTCSSLTYDGHKGTDIALPTLAALNHDVTVLAAADGVVLGIRNNMPDQLFTEDTAATVKGRECGNGIVLEHDDGWVTQYCHMKQGSISAQRGQRIERGEPLGLVGLSGKTQFAHLHLSVRKDGEVVDPFTPNTFGECGVDSKTLWDVSIPYQAGGLIASGFASAIPTLADIRAGQADEAPIPASAPALVFWTYIFGGRTGDVVSLHIQGPAGEFLDTATTLTKTQAQLFRAGGKKRRNETWPAGDYIGTAQLVRNGEILDTQRYEMTLPSE
nr:M23 family metallopeptidase [Epibacterium ulvae]